MLEITRCIRNTPTSQWASFSWHLFDTVTNPAIILPLLLIMIILPWVVRSWRWKRQISSLGLLLFLSYSLLASPIAVHLGNRLLLGLLPQDTGHKADAIVILGRGPDLRRDRIQAAAQLWQSGRAPVVFVSGAGDAEPIAQALAHAGLPDRAIEGEPCSRTTEENAKFTAAFLKSQNKQRILLVTDWPHMLRSVLTFRSFGLTVIPHPTAFPAQYQTRKQAFLILREYLGLASYGLLGRFEPRPAPPVDSVAMVDPIAKRDFEFGHAAGSDFAQAG